ncbi:MAG: FeoA family protein [bacterium]|nr:FeoA family protein [bacterium]
MFTKLQDSIAEAVNSIFKPEIEAKKNCGKGNCRGQNKGYRSGQQAVAGELPLSHCHTGDLLAICRIVGRGPVRRRLLEMGLNSGTEIRIVKYAPLKDPLECVIKGYHIALRVAEAGRIIVKPLNS